MLVKKWAILPKPLLNSVLDTTMVIRVVMRLYHFNFNNNAISTLSRSTVEMRTITTMYFIVINKSKRLTINLQRLQVALGKVSK